MRKLKPKDGFWIVACNDCGDEFYWNRIFATTKPTFHICDACADRERRK